MGPHPQGNLTEGAIYNPKNRAHFMQVFPSPSLKLALVSDFVIASSTGTLIVREVCNKAFPPVVYFPEADVVSKLLLVSNKTTHCPLKGQASYFHLRVAEKFFENAAWAYDNTFTFSKMLKGYIAFGGQGITICKG